jgi:phosphoribosylanthranilate isomerase
MIVKICGITNLDDALAAAEAGATALGFNFWKGSKRFVERPAAARMISELPQGILAVGVFVDTPASVMDRFAEEVGLDVVQLHGELDRRPRTRLWQALSATHPNLPESMNASPAEAFLIDAPAGAERGGTGKTFDWTLAANLPRPVILAGGLGPDNVAQAIRAVRPLGVDACSRLEFRPGKKDPVRMTEFVRAALEEA